MLEYFQRGRLFDNLDESKCPLLICLKKAQKHIQRVLENDYRTDTNRLSLFIQILNSDMPESERSVTRLSREAQTLFGAGTVSAARTMSFASYYILSQPKIRMMLENEVADVMAEWPDKVPTWAELDRLPYLQAIIKESLRYASIRYFISFLEGKSNFNIDKLIPSTFRLSYGVMHRLPRVSPDVPIQYKHHIIPAGVSVPQYVRLSKLNGHRSRWECLHT